MLMRRLINNNTFVFLKNALSVNGEGFKMPYNIIFCVYEFKQSRRSCDFIHNFHYVSTSSCFCDGSVCCYLLVFAWFTLSFKREFFKWIQMR